MTLYLDASSIMGELLRDSSPLPEWKSPLQRVTSELAKVECLRVLDRLRLERRRIPEDIVALHAELYQFMSEMFVVDLTKQILARASEPMPEFVGSLDAIHLATALMWREEHPEDFFMATHDNGLARVARSYGIKVVGDPA